MIQRKNKKHSRYTKKMIFVEPVFARIGRGGGNVACFDRLPNDLENVFSMYLVSPLSIGRRTKRETKSKSQRTIVDAILLRPQLGYITELRYN